jgi:hypothetical protein
MFLESVFAKNPLNRDYNLRGEVPIVEELHTIDPAAMVAGVITVEVVSKFGLGKGEVFGVKPLQSTVLIILLQLT